MRCMKLSRFLDWGSPDVMERNITVNLKTLEMLKLNFLSPADKTHSSLGSDLTDISRCNIHADFIINSIFLRFFKEIAQRAKITGKT